MTRNATVGVSKMSLCSLKAKYESIINLYGIKVHSDSAFLSFLKNSRNEIGAFSSGYLERKVEGLSFSIPADSVSVGLNQVVPFLRTSAYWNGLVSKLSPEAGQSSSLIIRPKIGRDYTRRSLRKLCTKGG